MKKTIILVTMILYIITPMLAYGEECVDGVRALVLWTTNWRGNANEFPNIAREHGLTINADPLGCSDNNPCVLVYHSDYGHGINSTYGHVAALYNGNSPYRLRDSNGICGGDRAQCTRETINFNKASVIHPPVPDNTENKVSGPKNLKITYY